MDSTTSDRSTRRQWRSFALTNTLRVVPLLVLSLVLTAPARSDHQNTPPTASFTNAPSNPVVGELVTFTSTSADPDGIIVDYDWDTDNDGSFDDGDDVSATGTFSGTPGPRTVSLRVDDDDGATRTVSRTISVAANGAPTAAFSASTTTPDTGQTVTLTSTSSDPEGRLASQQWDLDNDGSYDDGTGGTASVSFPNNGTRRVSLRVTDSGGTVGTTFRDIAVQNRRPTAAFGVSATEVDTGTPITFTSSSTDPDGTVASYRWDFDNNGTTDATGPTASRSFADDGTPTVTLSVTDDDGGIGSTSRQVTIRNRAPSASFTYAPADPVAGEEVELSSAASDSDGTVAEQRWDLDGDGVFDDATGAEVSTVFAAEGPQTVGLQVTDDDGAASAPALQTIDVRPAPPAPPEPPPPAGSTPPPASFPPAVVDGPKPPKPTLVGPRLLDPFPRVRIRGVTTPRGARLDLLSVRTSGGTKILVRCKGRGCPWARKTELARFGASRLRSVNMPGFKRRHLRAGTVLEVFVTQRGMIGKYTRFKIRRLKAPLRVDSCTAPGVARVRRCPA
jgi:PKD repeat protein